MNGYLRTWTPERPHSTKQARGVNTPFSHFKYIRKHVNQIVSAMAIAPATIFSAVCRARTGRGSPNVRTSLAANTRPMITASSFHSARRLQAVKPFILADVGEGNASQFPALPPSDELQVRENARSSSGLSSLAQGCGSSTRYARFSRTRRPQRYFGFCLGIRFLTPADNLAVRWGHKKALLRTR